MAVSEPREHVRARTLARATCLVVHTELDPNEPSPPPTYMRGYSAEVPAGWSRLAFGNSLARPNDPATMAINLILDVAPHSQTPGCDDTVEPGVATDAKALADWLTTLPGLVTTTPTPITIGGSDGWLVDASLDPAWAIPCRENHNDPTHVLFTFTDPAHDPNDGVFIRNFLELHGRSRVVLLDVGTGHNLLIEIVAPDQASWDDLLQTAMPIVESLEFTP